MEVRISVSEGDLADLESLNDWLRGERELAGRVKLAAPPPHRGVMGGAAEEIVITALSSGGAISVLISSLKGWLSLPHKSHVTIKLDKDGHVIKIDADQLSSKSAEALVREALESAAPEE